MTLAEFRFILWGLDGVLLSGTEASTMFNQSCRYELIQTALNNDVHTVKSISNTNSSKPFKLKATC